MCALACTHASHRSLDHCHSQHNGPDREYAVEPREGVVDPHSTDINTLSQRAPNFLVSSHTSDSCSHVTTTLSFLTGEERNTKRRHSVGFSSDKSSGSVFHHSCSMDHVLTCGRIIFLHQTELKMCKAVILWPKPNNNKNKQI